jgi:FdhE protein
MLPAKILQPGEIESLASPVTHLLLPDPQLFIRRSERLRRLAQAHSIGDYLGFVASIAEQQQALLDSIADLELADIESTRLLKLGLPPLSATDWQRDPLWRDLARALAKAVMPNAPPPARTVLNELSARSDDWLEDQASALIGLDLPHLDIATSPIIAGALQVYWTRLAQAQEPARIPRPGDPSLCPVCGSHPMVSLVQLGGEVNALRYLVCSLCGSQWYLERAKCSSCGNTRDIGYQTVENPNSAIRAESCPECHGYLKILYRNQSPDLEPTADDLASLALDWLMSEEGYSRTGVNLMLLQGADDAAV